MATQVQAQAPQATVVETDVEANFDVRCILKRKETPGKKASLPFAAPSLLLGYKSGKAQLTLTFNADALLLTRKRNGKTVTLATIRQFYTLPKQQAIPLIVQWRNGSLRVISDKRTILRREGLGALAGNGAIATTSGSYELAEALCQPVEPVAFADDFMRAAEDKGQWESSIGTWKIHSAADPTKVANAFTYMAQGKPAVAVTGHWFWDDYRIGVAVRPVGQNVVGLIVYWQDANNYVAFKWLPEDDERGRGHEKQLWRVWNGRPMLLATAEGGFRAKQWYHLSASAGGGLVTASVDGQQVLQKRTDLFGQGKAGLYSSGSEPVMMDDVTVDHVSKSERVNIVRREAITPQFTKEQSMESWASPKAEWLATTNAVEPTFWHRGTFFGDHALEIKATALEPNRAKVTAMLCGDGQSATSGYALVVTQKADKERLESVLLRQGQAVSRPYVSKIVAPAACTLRVERVGRMVRAYVGKEMVASYADSNPLTGRRAGYSVQGAQVPFDEARLSGGNLYDYTFYRAPTDWYVSGGTWDMTSRWDCSPGWSWYGGWSERIAAIWNKHSFAGDFAIDLFAACKRDVGGYQHPRDINITIGGDGRDLASGYSFIFGGWNNTATRILRGTQTVAETTKVLLPANYQAQAHHKWFNLRVERTGNIVSFYVDRELALRYIDPKPLPGRRIALWTNGNGVIIARATLYYQQELTPEPVPALIQNRGLRTVAVENLGWKVRGNDPALRLDAVEHSPKLPTRRNATRTPKAIPAVRALNLEGGGQFAIVPELEAFDALKTPRLSFDVLLEKSAAINLYLRVKDIYHSIRLTGSTKDTELEATKVLGAAKDVRADGQWHRVSLDVAALLKPLYPNDPEIRVDEAFLGNLTRDTYRQAGFGANTPGTSYLVRSFALHSTDNRIAKMIEPRLKAVSSPLKIAAAPPSLASSTAPAPIKAEAGPAPIAAQRGLLNLRVTYCQDVDAGAFKTESLNQPISWRCFSRPLFTKAIASIDFDWADKSPHAGISAKYWSARFFGKLVVPKQGDYIFYLDRLDDGARLYIDGQLVLDSWKIQAATSQESKPVALSPGAHDIRLDYSQGTGLGSLTLRWSGTGFEKEIIPVTKKTEIAVQTAMIPGKR